jgi:hypothetical protein
VTVDIDEDASSDDAVLGVAVDAKEGVSGDESLRVRPVVEAELRVADVTQAVELAGGLRVEAVQDFVAVKRVVGKQRVAERFARRDQRFLERV